MDRHLLRDKAMELRRAGLSIGDIVKKTSASKSTIFYWCKDIQLTEEQKSRLMLRRRENSRRILLKYSQEKKQQRLLVTEKFGRVGAQDVGKLLRRDLFMVGLSLYWAEGYKKGSGEVEFTNSDPSAVNIMIRWFNTFYSIAKGDLIARVSINVIHAQRVPEVIQYWSRITGIPKQQFTKTSIILTQSKKVYANAHTHFGTLRIKVRRGTNLLRRILGSISYLQHHTAKV